LISGQKKQVLDLFKEGRNNYKLMNFTEAKKCFAKALEIDPNDGPSKTYLERCEEYIQDPPPPDWDGVYVMKTK
jgi:hypothetical protein